MEIIIKGEPKEIAALVLAVQERQDNKNGASNGAKRQTEVDTYRKNAEAISIR